MAGAGAVFGLASAPTLQYFVFTGPKYDSKVGLWGRSMKFQKWAAPATLGYGGVADPEYQ